VIARGLARTAYGSPSAARWPVSSQLQRALGGVAEGAVASVGGGLTAEQQAVDLRSSRFRDDERLQAAFDNGSPMRFGEEGPAVALLQQAFLDLGFLLPRSTDNGAQPPDGIFGIETARVVKGFQFRQGIAKDGVVGR
jgi:murein L,D-transpeptidase YcbB/YkuD